MIMKKAVMKRPDWARARPALAESVMLGLACVVTYLLATKLLSWVHSVDPADDLLGGMWAVIAAIFVNRSSYSESRSAAVSRMAATFVSFVYCLIYLTFLPFHTWALAVLVGLSALTATLIGRPGDAITAAITTTVVLVVAEVSPRGAWEQPLLRLADTAIGVAVGLASAWLDQRVIRPRIRLTPLA
jgi:uncharacterized membrane protein YgaE (UPF0421/DUF939 family)